MPSATRLARAVALALVLASVPGMVFAHGSHGTASVKAVATLKTKPTDPANKQASDPQTASKQTSKATSSKPRQATKLGAVVVTGLRASLESSEQLKRNSSQIVDAVTATNINSLPVRTVTQALQHIVGVSVDHFAADDDPDHPAAEGTGVLIRGLPYVASLLNGRATFSANHGRSLGFQDVPAGLMERVEVYKDPSAAVLPGGIGGTVNLVTRKPFDFKGQVIGINLGYNEGDMSQKPKPKVSFMYSNRWKTRNLGEIGFLVDLSAAKVASRNDGIQINPYVLRPNSTDLAYYAPDIAAGAPTDQVFVPGDVNWDEMNYNRRRLGLYAAFQWRPDRNFSFYSIFFRSNYNLGWNEHEVQTNESQYYNVKPASGTRFKYNNQGIFQRGTMASNSWRGSPPIGPMGPVEYYALNRQNTQYTMTRDWTNGFHWNISDNLRLSGYFQMVKSTSNVLDFTVYNQLYMPAAKVDLSGGIPSFKLTDPAFLDSPAHYYLGAAMDHIQRDYGRMHAFAMKMQYYFNDSDWLHSVTFGVRGADRYAHSNNNNSNYNWGAVSQVWMGDYTGHDSLDWASKLPGWMNEQYTLHDFFRGAHFPTTFWFPSQALVQNYYKAKKVIPPLEMAGGWVPQIPGQSGENNHLTEKTEAAFAMLYFGHRVFGVRMDGNVGLRFVATQVSANGFLQFPKASNISGNKSDLTAAQLAFFSGAFVPRSGSTHYHNVIPSLNLNFHLTDDLQWRIAASEAFTRPPITKLNSYMKIGASWGGAAGKESKLQGFTARREGNPALKPIQAYQFDTALEWYFAPSGDLFTTLFYKDLKNYINDRTTVQVIKGQKVAVTGPVNSGGDQLKGIEIGYQQFYRFLPGWLKGLGVKANWTYIQTGTISSTTSCDPDHPNGSCSAQYVTTNPPLPPAGFSPHSFNFTAMYDYKKWTARLSWSWRSKYLITTEDSGDTYLPMWDKAYGKLNASLIYKVNKHIQIALLMNNLNNATTRVLMGPATYVGISPSKARPAMWTITCTRDPSSSMTDVTSCRCACASDGAEGKEQAGRRTCAFAGTSKDL